MAEIGTLVLLRHGQSTWNAENLFTGWVDVPLSEQGEGEARQGGQLLSGAGLLPDVVHTSLLRRAISTANIALDAADRHWIPVKRDWRLNERHYGALQGKDLGDNAPLTECLKDVVERLLPYWESEIVPDLRAGKTVLVAAHGNSLRALVKHLDGISDADIAGLNIPTGIPLRYDLTADLKPVKAGGEYLDPEAAKEAAAAVANQGR
jgi:2,3-bisphosphoglycerate-dependent phosphoglycerate mutase